MHVRWQVNETHPRAKRPQNRPRTRWEDKLTLFVQSLKLGKNWLDIFPSWTSDVNLKQRKLDSFTFAKPLESMRKARIHGQH